MIAHAMAQVMSATMGTSVTACRVMRKNIGIVSSTTTAPAPPAGDATRDTASASSATEPMERSANGSRMPHSV